MMRILIIEDDERVHGFLRRKLEAEGYDVDVAEDGPRGLARALRGSCDLVVLDLLLPRLDGLSVLRELNRECPLVPVLILTARSDLATKLRSFELGACDYLSKPFALEEFLARVHVHVHARDPNAARLIRAAGLVLDVTRREVQIGEAIVVLSDREFRLLHMLVEHAGEVVSREALWESVWGYTFDPGSNVVEVCVRRVRRKLGPSAPIETVHHEGYRLAAA